jgi:hypothetical protein
VAFHDFVGTMLGRRLFVAAITAAVLVPVGRMA